MARLMARTIGPQEGATLIVPVPLHRGRLWWRGYNQSALIARALAERCGGTVAVDLLQRTERTPLLRGLGPSARRKAVSGAFAIPPDGKTRLKGAHVILVDDVYTTGATAAGCARALRRAGREGAWDRAIR